MTKFVPSGYLSIRDALDRLGRELFPSAWTGEEHKARRGLISEEEWLKNKDLPPARGAGACGSGRSRKAPAAKATPDSSDDPSNPMYQEEYRAGKRQMEAHHRLRELLEAGRLEAAILDPWSGKLHRASASLWRRFDADRMIERGKHQYRAGATPAHFWSGDSPRPTRRESRCHRQESGRRSRP